MSGELRDAATGGGTTRRDKRIVVACVCLIFAYPAIEMVSFFALTAIEIIRPRTFSATVDEIFARLDQSDLDAYFKGEYDPLLGWDNKPGTSFTEKNCLGEMWTESFGADGARDTPRQFDTTLIATYGDSYLKGGEVDNDQTWQYQLAQSLGQNVKNYAVGAYGSYQAVLKLKRHVAQGRVYPITLLGIHEQNVKRVVNLYRPFLYRRVSEKLAFKPGLGCKGDKCVPIGNLLQPDVNTIEAARRAALQARRWDYWARTRPAYEFPWSLNVFKLVRLVVEELTKTDHEPLWHAPEGMAAMDEVISEFRDVVIKAGSKPVVLFIPNSAKSGSHPSYLAYKQGISARYPDLVVLDLSEAKFDVRRFRLKPANCHPSEYGHGVIARTVGTGLSGLLPDTRQTGGAPGDSNGR